MSSSPIPPGRNAIRGALHQLIGDRYEVMQWIGGGGMADVFLARHRLHGAYFAVKVLAEQLAGDPAIVSRFTEEARTAATLGGHPNIGEIFDIGESAGVHYLIMPYVEGEDLSSYLERRGRLPAAAALEAIRQVTEALVWAGERKVVHRDLKPSNIRIDRTGRAIVLDFGIAKASDVPSNLTRAGERPGTPYYMSPEQIKGETCDQRSDLYSLGVIFFELLSGSRPFGGETLRAIEFGHVSKLPPALSTIIPDVDPRLEQIVNRLLEKEPAKRYQTAKDLLIDLREVSQGLPAIQLEPQLDRTKLNAETEAVPAIERVSAPPQGPDIPAVKTGYHYGDQQQQPPAASPGKKTSWLIPAAIAAVVAIGAGVYFFGMKTSDGKVVTKDTNTKPEITKSDLPRTNLSKTITGPGGTMLLVAGGKFVFGSDDPVSPNKKQDASLPDFYIDSTEVSNGQYAKFATATAHAAPDSDTYKPSPSLPVAGVTSADAQAYCTWAGGRLPSEQEWEKAARGPAGPTYPWGNDALPSPGKLVAVDDYPERQSPYQALNMAGNVFEWTASAFPVTDREIDDMKKLTGTSNVSRDWSIIKGGSFLLKDERFFRTYMRRGWPANQASPLIGFRCVKNPS